MVVFNEIAEGLHDLTFYVKDIMKFLRELRKSSPLASKMLKLLSEGKDSSVVSLMCSIQCLSKFLQRILNIRFLSLSNSRICGIIMSWFKLIAAQTAKCFQ